MIPYNWQADGAFDHPADLLARNESDEDLIWVSQERLPLVADLLEEELRCEAVIEALREMEDRFGF